MNTENTTTPENEEKADNNQSSTQTAEKDSHVEAVADAATDSKTTAELEKALAEAQAKANDNWSLYLEAKAEIENIRKRASRDVENAHKYALDKFIPELLLVKDSLEMGLKAAEDSNEMEKFIEGNHLMLKLFNDTLAKFNIIEVYPQGEAFNPDLHEAMSMIASEEHPANTVIDVMQKGYTLNERLVRPALVVVSQGK